METKAQLRNLRIAPRKVRLIADLVRRKTVGEAQALLNFTIKRGVGDLLNLLKSAIANAKNNFHLEETNLYIKKISVDEGSKYKRWMPRARGQASQIQKKTSHITIVLDEIKEGKKVKKTAKIKKVKEAPTAAGTVYKEEKTTKPEKAKFRPGPETEAQKPKAKTGLRRIFRRMSF